MKIHPNTHKGAPLEDAIDAFAEAYDAERAQKTRDGDWRVRLHIADVLGVKEETVTGKDVTAFIRRMGATYLARKISGIGQTTAERLWKEAHDPRD